MKIDFKTPTKSALDMAWRNAERDAAKYRVTIGELAPGYAVVEAIDEHSRYDVILPGVKGLKFGKCGCPFYKNCGTCKHIALAEAEVMIQRDEAEFEEKQEAAAFMDWCAMDRAAASAAQYNTRDIDHWTDLDNLIAEATALNEARGIFIP